MILNVVLIVLSALIILYLFKNIIDIMNTKEDFGDSIVICFDGHKEDAEFILRKAIIDAKWNNKNDNIICADNGMDEETRKICQLICKDYKFVHLKK